MDRTLKIAVSSIPHNIYLTKSFHRQSRGSTKQFNLEVMLDQGEFDPMSDSD